MKQLPIILDCDPGADDALAILLALASPELDVLGITTSFGNSSVENTTWNATRTCVLAGRRDVKVSRGAAQPLFRKLKLDTLYGGSDGLCCCALAGDAKMVTQFPADAFLMEALLTAREPVTVISTACMTNLASALLRAPAVARGIKEVVTVSGYYGLNPNVARAGWNILVDPHAAKLVLESGVRVRAAGLDVTALLQDGMVDTLLKGKQGPVCDFLAHATAYNRANGLFACSILVDAMAVATALSPGLAKYEHGYVTVDPTRTDSGLMRFEKAPAEDAGSAVMAASSFHYADYLELLRGRVFPA